MKSTFDADSVTVEFTRDDYDVLLIILGYATGAAHDPDMQRMMIRFVNAINQGNPSFIPYEVPAEDKPL
jgi:hypothetical protein